MHKKQKMVECLTAFVLLHMKNSYLTKAFTDTNKIRPQVLKNEENNASSQCQLIR